MVQRLYDTEAFLRVEADVPVPAFDPEGLGATTAPVRRRTSRDGAVVRAADDDCAQDPAAATHDWALREMHVPEALALLPRAVAGGRGIRVGHPDSGYTDHASLGLSQLDLATDRDVISGDDDAKDPLRSPKQTIFRPLPNPGHGTSTASVLVGVGDGAGFRGVAPGATLVPIRATESVVQVFDTDVAKAVRWARQHGCHVVSMSLGGKGLFGLEDAIQEAVNDGMIVLAAAGNQVGFVTAPASYPNCLAVAATRPGGQPWSGSSHGKQVDVAAPGACVWAAMFDWKQKPPGRVTRQSHGTSYAVAHVAGVAALWLAKWGHAELVDKYGKANIQNLFLTVLRRPGVCRQPVGWDASQYGAGVIDALALLEAALPVPAAVGVPRAALRSARNDPLERIALHVDRSPAEVAAWIDQAMGPGTSTDLETLRRFEGELVYHLSTPEWRVGLTAASRSRGRPNVVPEAALASASPQMRALLRGGRRAPRERTGARTR